MALMAVARVMLSVSITATIAHVPTASAAPLRCADLFARAGSLEPLKLALDGLAPQVQREILERVHAALRRGSVSSAQIAKLARVLERLGEKRALSLSRLIRLDFEEATADLARTELAAARFAEAFAKIAVEEGLLKEPSRLETALARFFSPSNGRSALVWASVHASVNTATFLVFQQPMLAPVYMPSMKFRLSPDRVRELADRSGRIGFENAFRELKPGIAGTLHAQLAYKLVSRAMNAALLAIALEFIIDDLPEEMDEAKARQLIANATKHANEVEASLISINNDLILGYEKRLGSVEDPRLHQLILEEIARLKEQNDELSASRDLEIHEERPGR